MKRLTLLLALLLTVGPALAQKHYDEIDFPDLPDFNVPEATRVALPNGMVVFLIEDHELPLVSLSARVGVGSVYEPADKVGLAAVTGDVMRTGGTEAVSGDELNERLESIGAVVETNIGETSGSAFMSTLKEYTEEVLPLFADVLMNPAFPEDKIDLAKTQQKSAISRRNDNPQQIAFREFTQVLYGEESPYARTPEYATVEAIDRADLVAFHERFFHPNNVILGVWGDFDTDAMVRQLREAFAAWPKKDGFARPDLPPMTTQSEAGVYFAPKADVTQSVILMGHPGEVRRDDPDYHAIQLMNEVLSGGFGGRLFQNVRDDKGLAYAVFGTYSAGYDQPGPFYAGVMTKSESTVEAAQAVREEVEKMQQAPPTGEEISRAKESFLNSFVFNFDTRREIVDRMATYEYYGYPMDFLEQEKEGLEKVSGEDVLRVSKKYLKPGKMKIFAVGNEADFGEPLSTLGAVKVVDITIPTGEAAVPEATEEALSEGEALFDGAVAALGGKAAFAAVKTMQVQATTTVTTPDNQQIPLSIDATLAFPDRARFVQGTPMGEIIVVMNGETMRLKSPQGTMDAPPPVREQIRSSLWHDLTYLFAHADEVTVQHVGQEEAEGKPAEVLLITPPGGAKPFRLYLDATTKRPVMMTYQGSNMMGAPVAAREVYDDFREVAGLTLPFKSVEYQDDKQAQETSIDEIEVNADVAPGTFELD